MTVDFSLEAILGIVGGLTGLIVVLIGVVVMLSRVINQASKTNIRLNDEMQQGILFRQTLSLEIEAVKDDCTEREQKIGRTLVQFEQGSRAREKTMQGEIDELKTQISVLENEVERLQSELASEKKLRAADRARFQEQIDDKNAEFQRQIDEKNAEIAALKARRAELEKRLSELETQMNGKQDKLDEPPVDNVAETKPKTKQGD